MAAITENAKKAETKATAGAIQKAEDNMVFVGKN